VLYYRNRNNGYSWYYNTNYKPWIIEVYKLCAWLYKGRHECCSRKPLHRTVESEKKYNDDDDDDDGHCPLWWCNDNENDQ